MSLNYYAQLVIGPSGSGKSTYCRIISEMSKTLNRNVYVINLDPAADFLPYKPLIDIRDLITLKDVMEEYKLGPNGGLVFCLDYLMENFEWFEEELQNISQDDYVLIDCPGQLELYTHMQTIQIMSEKLINRGFSLCAVTLIDSTFIHDDFKFISGMLMALSFIVSLNIPHICVLSKCDLIANKDFLKKKISKFSSNQIDVDPFYEKEENEEGKTVFEKKYSKLTNSFEQIVGLLDRRLWTR